MNNFTTRVKLTRKNKFKRYLNGVLITFFSLIIVMLIVFKLTFTLYSAPIIQQNLVANNASYKAIYNEKNNENSKDNSINLMVWNIHKNDFNDSSELKNYSKNNDLILLQEAPTNRPVNAITKDATHPLNSVAASAFSFLGQQYGTMTLSDFPRLNQRAFNLAEPLIRVPKSALISEYLIYGHKVLVVNVHQINFALGLTSYAKYLNAAMQIIKNYTGAVILAGDFNSWSKSRLNFIHKITAENGFTAVDFSEFSEIDLRESFLGNKLDQVFVKGFQIIDARADKNTSNSDHRPLFVKLKFTR